MDHAPVQTVCSVVYMHTFMYVKHTFITIVIIQVIYNLLIRIILDDVTY